MLRTPVGQRESSRLIHVTSRQDCLFHLSGAESDLSWCRYVGAQLSVVWSIRLCPGTLAVYTSASSDYIACRHLLIAAWRHLAQTTESGLAWLCFTVYVLLKGLGYNLASVISCIWLEMTHNYHIDFSGICIRDHPCLGMLVCHLSLMWKVGFPEGRLRLRL